MYMFSFLGSPAVIANLRGEIDHLRLSLVESEKERRELLSRILEKTGSRPLFAPAEPLDPVYSPTFVEQWAQQDFDEEIKLLEEAARNDPETFGPILADARLKQSSFS